MAPMHAINVRLLRVFFWPCGEQLRGSSQERVALLEARLTEEKEWRKQLEVDLTAAQAALKKDKEVRWCIASICFVFIQQWCLTTATTIEFNSLIDQKFCLSRSVDFALYFAFPCCRCVTATKTGTENSKLCHAFLLYHVLPPAGVISTSTVTFYQLQGSCNLTSFLHSLYTKGSADRGERAEEAETRGQRSSDRMPTRENTN